MSERTRVGFADFILETFAEVRIYVLLIAMNLGLQFIDKPVDVLVCFACNIIIIDGLR